ncbi:hypothetical protein Nekkels1_19 [Cellulophaga phage Nekkels_1]|uniref:Uncharacterized protein n=1 Tax=Cellulophaga phage Nekkels_1 TaxID=2745692 RepID=A0A8E4UXF2_9CAUD|nr:hypothetical protein M1M31_gp19 [Cellulophaga phage Nekkels_1]QQO97018.1 hypothetical protein Nekkels1_19 [Cellulophaga phage Nekkels_1]QQO97111.1 hypothetical protein Nekkels2_19 [Cellulophaga phage Nekkels_2]
MSNIERIRLKKAIETRTLVFKTFNSGDDISISIIQKRCKVGYTSAYTTLRNLSEDGLVVNCNKNGVFKLA